MSASTHGGYRPGIDGLRALAVAAVLMFHLDRLPGGNLGVDAFFVVSGWLITWRLLNEADRHHTIDVRSFWNARLRRLMPASLTVLVAVAVVWPLAGIDVPSLRRDLLWAAGWASNWGTITGGGDYWARFGEPSPVTHFWSLAIEEQFYLVWPLVLFAVVRATRRRRLAVGVVSALAAAGSIAVMWATFDGADPTGTYMNTLARAHSLLIGATAASVTALLSDGRLRGGRFARRVAPLAAVVAVTMIAVSSHDSTWLFRWGFPTFAVAMAVVVVAVADGAGGGVLASGPLRWVGDRSYGMYLWHWPVFLLLTPDRLALAESAAAVAALDALRVAVAVALADLSFRLVESPIRAVRPRLRWPTPATAGVALGVTAVVAVTLVPPPPPSASEASVVRLPPVEASVDTEIRAAFEAETVAAASRARSTDARRTAQPDSSRAAPDGPVVGIGEQPATIGAGAMAGAAGAGGQAAEAPAEPPAATRPLRVLVAGDSTALHLSAALIEHAASVPDQLLVGSAAFPGCGLSAGSDGRLHEFTNPSGDRELIDLSGCLVQWNEIPHRVTAEAIDVVLVSIGPWDAVDIHVPATPASAAAMVSVADPAGRSLVEGAYVRFLEQVHAAGATVVWVTPPDTQLGWGTIDDPVNEPPRWAAVRAIIDDLAVAQIDLPGWLAAQQLEGPNGRPDGVHLTDDLNRRFVEEMVAPTFSDLVFGDA